jgi:hypothetical protein
VLVGIQNPAIARHDLLRSRHRRLLPFADPSGSLVTWASSARWDDDDAPQRQSSSDWSPRTRGRRRHRDNDDRESASKSFGKNYSNSNELIEARLERFFRSASDRFSRQHVADLVNGACRLNTLQGMRAAQDVVERWIVLSAAGSGTAPVDGDGDGSEGHAGRDRRALSPMPEDHGRNDAGEWRDGAEENSYEQFVERTTLDLWQQVVYGWSVLAPKHPVASVRMKEIVDRVVHEAAMGQDASEEEPETAGARETEAEASPYENRRLPPPNAPTVDLFNTYLFGLSQASLSSRSSAVKARTVLQDMDALAREKGWWCRPNTKSYSNVLIAYRNARMPGSAQAVMEILDDMIRAHVQQKHEYEAQYGVPYHDDDDRKNRRKIVTPDVETFTVAIQAIARSLEGTRDSLRDLLVKLTSGGGWAFDAKFWVSAIRAHARLVDQERSAKTRVEIAREAERVLLDEVVAPAAVDSDDGEQQQQRQPSDPEVVLAAWNACLDTWSRVQAKEAPVECERILQSMLSSRRSGAVDTVAPDTTSFNSCHYAWSRSTKLHHNAPQRSLELLQLQKDLGDPKCQPDFQTYALVILANGNAGNVPGARAVLEDMISYVRGLPSPPARNPAAPFSALLTSIAKTPASGGGTPTDPWAADSPGSGEDLYGVALQTYSEVTQDRYGVVAVPDHHTYSAMLRCIAAHTGGVERTARAREVFDAACEGGHVSRPVVEGLVSALGDEVARVMLRDVPRFWSRNVPTGERGHNRRQTGKRGPKKRMEANRT